MIGFIDGPAEGQALELRRTPVMLRVVHHGLTGEWDALDLLEDVAEPAETIHVYRLRGEVSSYHVLCAQRSRSRFINQASYGYLGPVADELVRDNAAWVRWCEGNRSWLLATPKATL